MLYGAAVGYAIAGFLPIPDKTSRVDTEQGESKRE
jgi:hypothetical protein